MHGSYGYELNSYVINEYLGNGYELDLGHMFLSWISRIPTDVYSGANGHNGQL